VLFLVFQNSHFHSATSFQCSHWKAKAVTILLQQKSLFINISWGLFSRHVSSYILDHYELKLFCKSPEDFILPIKYFL